MIHLLFCFLLVQTPQGSGYRDNLVGTKPLSMGGAGHGLADDNSAIDYNPAGMSRAPRYGIEFLYHWTPDVLSTFRGSVIDSLTSSVGTGLSYVREEIKGDETQRDMRNNFSFALSGSATRYVALGVELRALEFKEKYLSTLGYGILIRPVSEYLSLGATFHDATLLGGENPGLRRTISYGFALRLADMVTIVGDMGQEVGDDASGEKEYSAGAEVSIVQQLKVRGGYAWDNIAGKNYTTLGVGWAIPRLALEYGFRQDVRETKTQIHSVSLSIYPF